MLTKTTITAVLTAAALMLPFAGCSGTRNRAATGWQTDASAGRAANAGQNKPTAVESAIELSDKYARLTEEAAALRLQKQNLDAENQRLKIDLQSCGTQLEQANKELSEVNDLLVEMRVELNNWKTDVLGFRGEMRDAETAQLEALLKILKLMGAEPAATHTPAPSAPEEQK